MQLPRSAVLKYIVLIASHLKWAWDCLLLQSFFQPRGVLEFLEYVDDLNVECAVCLCRIDEGDEVTELRCNHLYHRVCLERWLGYGHRTCPLCRNNLKPPQLAENLHLQADVILINYCATRSRDNRCTWWLR
ncbi:putative E3 ubiquitin-protein ligase [Forsythia ovata]|uniref:E3 ubiquitin-protein ligase n=1 Tax=Forsythia ovata TaxID=205694 RepID=A0ABD1XEP5_9LAMI